MATDITVTPAVNSDPSPRLWTRDEYHRLAEQGFFDGQRVELIEGEIIVMSPQGIQHVIALHRVTKALERALGDAYWVRSQAPLAMSDDSVPEPDISVVLGPPERYREHPRQALLAVEVSDTSRSFDLRRKSKLYAAHDDVPEYWVVDLVDRVLYVMVDPKDGEYQSIQCLDQSAAVTLSTLPAPPIKVADLFPPAR